MRPVDSTRELQNASRTWRFSRQLQLRYTSSFIERRYPAFVGVGTNAGERWDLVLGDYLEVRHLLFDAFDVLVGLFRRCAKHRDDDEQRERGQDGANEEGLVIPGQQGPIGGVALVQQAL